MAVRKFTAKKDDLVGVDPGDAMTTLKTAKAVFHVVGVTPFIFNSMSFKTQTELLKPKKKTKAEKAVTLKHIPLQEFRDSTYRRRDGEAGPTRLMVPARMFKAAISDVAKRIPGAPPTTEVRQLLWVDGDNVDFYGVPEIFMASVRSADMNRTPDIRTRAIVKEWACSFSLTYMQPLINAKAVMKLLHSAGFLNGVGDYRQQKGSGNYGQFRIVTPDDADFKRIVKYGGRAVQEAALLKPSPYDTETEEMLNWFNGEISKLDPDSPDPGSAAEDDGIAEAAE